MDRHTRTHEACSQVDHEKLPEKFPAFETTVVRMHCKCHGWQTRVKSVHRGFHHAHRWGWMKRGTTGIAALELNVPMGRGKHALGEHDGRSRMARSRVGELASVPQDIGRPVDAPATVGTEGVRTTSRRTAESVYELGSRSTARSLGDLTRRVVQVPVGVGLSSLVDAAIQAAYNELDNIRAGW